MFRMVLYLFVLMHTIYTGAFTSASVSSLDFKWIVSIKKSGWHGTSHNCSGTIISMNHILTAASCVVGEEQHALSVRYGGTRHSNAKYSSKVVQIKVRPEYFESKNFDSDVAVLQLDFPIVFGDGVKAIELPKQGENIPPPVPLLKACGWGPSKVGGPIQDELHCAELRKIDHGTCAKAYAKKSVVSNSMICLAGGGGGNFCPIDIGGAAVRAKSGGDGFQLVAIKSGFRWSGCGHAGHPGVFTDISKHVDWIHGSING